MGELRTLVNFVLDQYCNKEYGYKHNQSIKSISGLNKSSLLIKKIEHFSPTSTPNSYLHILLFEDSVLVNAAILANKNGYSMNL